MPIRPARRPALLLGLSLLLLVPLVSHAAGAPDADARFKALYTKEWTWRQQQFGGYDDEDKASDPATATAASASSEA